MMLFEKQICECAGIGRQARLRGVCLMAYEFKSRHSHQKSTIHWVVLFVFAKTGHCVNCTVSCLTLEEDEVLIVVCFCAKECIEQMALGTDDAVDILDAVFVGLLDVIGQKHIHV